jgi:hypothetical protein
VKNAAEKTVLAEHNTKLNSKIDKAHVNEQKQLIAKYKDLLAEYLVGHSSKQIDAIYAMQVYAGSKGFPKYFLAHLFNAMYDLELIEEEAFYLWKDEINENYPNKGQALFHVNILQNLNLIITHFYRNFTKILVILATTLVQLAARGVRRVLHVRVRVEHVLVELVDQQNTSERYHYCC